MSTFNVYRLYFTTPLHLGDNRADYGLSLKTIQSDSLYAALTACLAKVGIDIPSDGDLGCTISSLFPFYQYKDSEPIYFFPKPLLQRLPRLKDIENTKKVKKVAWLDSHYFEKVLNGEILFEDDHSIAAVKKEYLTDRNDFDFEFIVSQISPRVAVSRNGKQDAIPFYMDRIFFKDNSGLFFIVQGDTFLIDKSIDLLMHEGIGTDKNIGNGAFRYEKGSIEIKLPESSVSVMSLSSFIPESEEQLGELIASDNIAYDFTRRGGWITTPPYNSMRKNVVYSFLSGSVFSKRMKDVEIMGKIVNLAPKFDMENIPSINHPIWRNGKSIFIPIKI